MPATIVLGGQWGDEGKGKITDFLAGEANMVVRANGGSNAGHTVANETGVYKLHLVPSGILHPECDCVIGAGVVIDPVSLAGELKGLVDRGIDTSRLLISDRAHVVLPIHPEIDRLEEAGRGGKQIGTTLKGIGPAYADKVSRVGIRMIDLLDADAGPRMIDGLAQRWSSRFPECSASILEIAEQNVAGVMESIEQLRPLIGSSETVVQNALEDDQRVVIEAAQGVLLDVDYGTYPFVTSSSPTAAGACQGAGVAPGQVDQVIGVFKAYSTRVGEGPMPTELFDETADVIRERGHEYGTTTGRPRRTGWFDAVAARQTARLNGVTEVALTLVDVFDTFEEIAICSTYELDGNQVDAIPASANCLERVEPKLQTVHGWLSDTTAARTRQDLPENALGFVGAIEQLIGAEVTMIGVGPDRDQLIRN